MLAPWIESGRSPTVPGTNAHASAMTPLILFIVHISWMTFGIVFFVMLCIGYLSIKGRSVKWLINRTKCSLRGYRISARPFYYRRRINRIQSYDESNISLFRRIN